MNSFPSTLLFLFCVLLFVKCSDDEIENPPENNNDNYITACDEAEFTISFDNTYFWDSDNAAWYTIDGPVMNPINNTQVFCRKYPSDDILNQIESGGLSVDDLELTNDSEIKVFNNPDGTQDVEFQFLDQDSEYSVIFGGTGVVFGVNIVVDDIASVPLNESYSGSEIMNCFIYESNLAADWTIVFSEKDIVNNIYIGNLICNWSVSPWVFPEGTSLNFSATIDFSFDM